MTDDSGDESKHAQQPSDSNPTESHALAAENADVVTKKDIRSADKIDPEDVDVQDVGWSNRDFTLSPMAIPGVPNGQLAAVIRRFDNQTFHVKTINVPPLANLDMNIAEKEEFSPEKLRAHLERLYTSVIVQLVSAWKQVAYLRSWTDWRRTSAFLSVYTAAWATDLLLSTMLAFLIILILSPPARRVCFPPIEPGLVGTTAGSTSQKGSSKLDSSGAITTSPETQAGEGAEREAHSFINSIATVI